MKKSNKPIFLILCSFNEKSGVKIIFCIFQCLITLEKISQSKTIFSQHKN